MNAPTFFHARLGRRRAFLSQADADAYDAGWSAWADLRIEPHQINTPFGTGFFDAENAELDRIDAMRFNLSMED